MSVSMSDVNPYLYSGIGRVSITHATNQDFCHPYLRKDRCQSGLINITQN